MLRNILNIEGIQELDKKAQQSTQGGTMLCEDECIFGQRRCYITKTEFIWVPC